MEALEYYNNSLLHGGIAVGRISEVYPFERLCGVHIIQGTPSLVGRYYPRAQWGSLDANPEGDESSTVPRVGSIGLVFVLCGQAIVWGFIKPTTRKNGARTGKEYSELGEGDKIFSTSSGNRIVLKTSGLIELYSGENLKSLFFPKGGIWSTICEEMQVRTDGGNLFWRTIDPALNTTVFLQEYRKDLARTSIIYDEIGFVDATTIKRSTMGVGVPGVVGVPAPLYEYTMDITGKEIKKFGPGGILTVTSQPTGEFEIKNAIGTGSLSPAGDWKIQNAIATAEMTAAGDVNILNAVAEAHLASTGDIEIKNKTFSVTATAAGDIEIKNPTVTVTATATGDIEIKNPIADIKVDASGDYELSNATCKMIMKSSGELEFSGPVGKLKIDAAGKIGLGGPAAELFSLIDQFLDAFIKQPALCMTPVGPSGPLLPPAMVTLTTIKTLLALIKGSV